MEASVVREAAIFSRDLTWSLNRKLLIQEKGVERMNENEEPTESACWPKEKEKSLLIEDWSSVVLIVLLVVSISESVSDWINPLELIYLQQLEESKAFPEGCLKGSSNIFGARQNWGARQKKAEEGSNFPRQERTLPISYPHFKISFPISTFSLASRFPCQTEPDFFLLILMANKKILKNYSN